MILQTIYELTGLDFCSRFVVVPDLACTVWLIETPTDFLLKKCIDSQGLKGLRSMT